MTTEEKSNPLGDLDKYNITREKVIDMLYEDRQLARKEGKLAAAISVTKLFGDSIGMFKPATDNPTTLSFVRPFTENDKKALEAIGLNFAEIEIDPNRG